MSQSGTASRLPGKNRQGVSYLERYILLEAGTREDIRRIVLNFSIRHSVVRFPDIEIQVAVRIRPLDLRYSAFDSDWLVRVILRAKRVMRFHTRPQNQDTDRHEKNASYSRYAAYKRNWYRRHAKK